MPVTPFGSEGSMTALVPFDLGGVSVRFGTDSDGRPWVAAQDFAVRLGYRDAANALRNVDEAEKGTQIVSTPGGDQRISVLYEEGIWELIFLSRRPEAKAIKARVKEILKEIRQTGRYVVPQDFASALELAAQQQRELIAAAPKVEAFDAYMDADNHLSMGAVANQLGIGRNTMMRKLREAGVLQKDNRPYQRYAHHFKVVATTYEAQNSTRATHTTYVRPSGVELIRKVLSGGKGLLSISGGAA